MGCHRPIYDTYMDEKSGVFFHSDQKMSAMPMTFVIEINVFELSILWGGGYDFATAQFLQYGI